MKKAVKVIGVIALACVFATGGYMVGHNEHMDNIISAMPKKSIDKPIDEVHTDAPMAVGTSKASDEPKKEEEVRVITKSDKSAVDESWSIVENTSNTTDNGGLTLYTSAQKEGDEFLWDDSQKWVVEMSDGNGGYYTLYDQLVSNGSVYYDIVQNDNGDKVINVYTMSGAGTTIKQYTRTDTGYNEKTVYNSGAVNRLFTTVPVYR